jgi:hypothetical protein
LHRRIAEEFGGEIEVDPNFVRAPQDSCRHLIQLILLIVDVCESRPPIGKDANIEITGIVLGTPGLF